MAISGLTALTPDAYPANTRILTDAAKLVTVSLPASAATANTAAIDLQNITPYPTTETINVNVSATASANGNSVNGTIVLQDSGDNSSFTTIAVAWSSIATVTVPIVQGASSTVAVSTDGKLPITCRRYVRAQAVLPANTADLSDSTLTFKLLF